MGVLTIIVVLVGMLVVLSTRPRDHVFNFLMGAFFGALLAWALIYEFGLPAL